MFEPYWGWGLVCVNFVCIYIGMCYVGMYVCMYVGMYVCRYVCMYVLCMYVGR